MPIQINTSIKGKEYPPYRVSVERGKIKEFARAIGQGLRGRRAGRKRFAATVRLGDVVTCRGTVVAKRPLKDGDGPYVVDLELSAENQKGEKIITGRATVALVSRG